MFVGIALKIISAYIKSSTFFSENSDLRSQKRSHFVLYGHSKFFGGVPFFRQFLKDQRTNHIKTSLARFPFHILPTAWGVLIGCFHKLGYFAINIKMTGT